MFVYFFHFFILYLIFSLLNSFLSSKPLYFLSSPLFLSTFLLLLFLFLPFFLLIIFYPFPHVVVPIIAVMVIALPPPQIDENIGYLYKMLTIFNLLDTTDVIVLSDHGMVAVLEENIIDLDQIVDPKLYHTSGGSPVMHIWPYGGVFTFVPVFSDFICLFFYVYLFIFFFSFSYNFLPCLISIFVFLLFMVMVIISRSIFDISLFVVNFFSLF